MKIFLNILLIILAVILQITFLPSFEFKGVFPNLVFVGMLSLLLVGRKEESLWWAGIGGISLDLFSPGYFGIYTLSFLAVYAAVYFLIMYVFSDPSLIISVPIFFVGTMLVNLCFLLMTGNYTGYFTEATYNTFVGCIVYGLVKIYYSPK